MRKLAGTTEHSIQSGFGKPQSQLELEKDRFEVGVSAKAPETLEHLVAPEIEFSFKKSSFSGFWG